MEQLLLQSFKFFDMDNSGGLNPLEFSKAIEKIGIMIPTKQDLQTLFSLYDISGDGVIDYREFASGIFGYEIVSGVTPRSATYDPEVLMTKLRVKLAGRGTRGIIGLARQFKIMDDNNSMSLD